MPVTDQQARALAFLAVAARPHGAPRWDEAGVLTNVLKVADRSLASVMIAVAQAAEDRNAATPGVIPTAGPHWRAPEAHVAPVLNVWDDAAVCTTCSRTEAACTRTRPGDDDHPFISRARNNADTARPPEAVARCVDSLREEQHQ